MNSIQEDRSNELKTKRICRFCLTRPSDKLSLTSIYSKDARVKASAALPLQVMAITAIEVTEDDNMPSLVCTECRILFEHSYRFKQMCKNSDILLRQFPLTGILPDPLDKPRISIIGGNEKINSESTKKSCYVKFETLDYPKTQGTKHHNAPKKLLNSTPAAVPEPPAPVRVKVEKKDMDATIIFLNKVENNEELSMDDVQGLLLSDCLDDVNEEADTVRTVQNISPFKPKLLNKSSMRILNKDADVVKEPRLRKPQLTCDDDGNAVIVTQILDPSDPYEPEPDPIKTAAPVKTNVFPCSHCDRSFPLRQLRDIHMVNHNRERSFKCSECEKSFFSKYDLQKHSFIHTGEKPFKCHVCEKAFTRATLLHRHEKTHTDVPKFVCLYCEKPFISEAEMEKHTERHQKHRPFTCKTCSKSFAFKQGLERHELTHSSDLPYPCQYCSESFFTPGKLARHLTAHAGKRAYPCKFCSKSYLLSHHLTRHLRSHKQSRSRFTCGVCVNFFSTYVGLVDHSKYHAFETKICPLCKETNIEPNNVVNHMNAHSDGGIHACEFCDLIFISNIQLENHIKHDHSIDMVPYQEITTMNDTLNEMDQYSVDDFIIDDVENVVKVECTASESADHNVTKILKKPEIISQIIIQKGEKQQMNVDATKTKVISNVEENMQKNLKKFCVQTDSDPPTKVRKIGDIENKSKITEVTLKSTRNLRKKRVDNLSVDPHKTQQKETVLKSISPGMGKSDSVCSVLKSLPKSVSVKRSLLKQSAPITNTDS